MDRTELLHKISTFPLIASVLAEHLWSGAFPSIFKGQGIEVDEVRHYQRGDDIRTIDWNVSARFGTPYVKRYREEREMQVFLVLDCSASMYCGSVPISRYDQALLCASLIAFSANQAGQSLGALFFDRAITHIFPPQKGRAHIMAIISRALSIKTKPGGSDLGTALAGLGRLLKQRALVVVISDFLSVHWEPELGNLCRKHDVIALRIQDPLDRDMAGMGLISLEDPETRLAYQVPASFPSFCAAWSAWHEQQYRSCQGSCRTSGAAFMNISTADDAPAQLIRFFGNRGIPRHRRPRKSYRIGP
ncbi:MAG: DUF58 domain-containing protein [Treponema sp.]|jgi:uncharacterized protein (DUF58 family)|nr:DUF58 domain-containing protein [Treponema sp.]